jgi:hypothetical protein
MYLNGTGFVANLLNTKHFLSRSIYKILKLASKPLSWRISMRYVQRATGQHWSIYKSLSLCKSDSRKFVHFNFANTIFFSLSLIYYLLNLFNRLGAREYFKYNTYMYNVYHDHLFYFNGKFVMFKCFAFWTFIRQVNDFVKLRIIVGVWFFFFFFLFTILWSWRCLIIRINAGLQILTHLNCFCIFLLLIC